MDLKRSNHLRFALPFRTWDEIGSPHSFVLETELLYSPPHLWQTHLHPMKPMSHRLAELKKDSKTGAVSLGKRLRIGSLSGNTRGPLLQLIAKYAVIVAGPRSSSMLKALKHFTSHYLSWRGGFPSLVRYYKVSAIRIQQLLAEGPVTDVRELGSIVGCNKRGVPLLVTPEHRKAILSGDREIIRLWLGLFTLHRVLPWKTKPRFGSIVAPGKAVPDREYEKWEEFISKSFYCWLSPRDPARWSKPLQAPALLGMTSAGPNSSGEGDERTNSIECSEIDAVTMWNKRGTSWWKSIKDFSLGIKEITLSSAKFRVWFTVSMIASRVPPLNAPKRLLSPLLRGRLHVIQEPAGKSRIVAIANYWVQQLLYPLHTRLFEILRSIREDGTFDQAKPGDILGEEIRRRISLGYKKVHVYSYDLKSATDRMPVDLQVKVLTPLIGALAAKGWKGILTDMPYHLTAEGKRPQPFWYKVGQPMGAYSSWGAMALTHHAIVQYAAHLAGVKAWYPHYAVLGDDVVILGKHVAEKYLHVMDTFGIPIGLHKSLISTNGTFEYAKRFYYKGVNTSHISLTEFFQGLVNIPSFLEVVRKARGLNPRVRLVDAIRARDHGFKSGSSLTNPLIGRRPGRVTNLILALIAPGAPFDMGMSFISSIASAIKADESQFPELKPRKVYGVLSSVARDLIRLTSGLRQVLHSYEHRLRPIHEVLLILSSALTDPEGTVIHERALRLQELKSVIDRITTLGRVIREGHVKGRGGVVPLIKAIRVLLGLLAEFESLPPLVLDDRKKALEIKVSWAPPRLVKIRNILLGQVPVMVKRKMNVTITKPAMGSKPKPVDKGLRGRTS